MSITQLSLNLTDDCSFNCVNCTERSPNPRDMDIDTAKKAVDFLLKQSGDSPLVSLGFFGGEPLQRFEGLKEITAYARELAQNAGKDLELGITTKGALLTPAALEFLQENDFSVLVDLCRSAIKKDINESNLQTPLFDTKRIVDRAGTYFNDTFAVKMSVTPENVDEVFETFMYFIEKKINSIGVVPNPFVKWNLEAIDSFAEQMTLCINYWLDTIEDLNLNFQPIGHYVAAIQGKLKAPSLHMHYCTLQRLGVAVDGTLFPCHRFASFPEQEKYCLGNVKTGLDRRAYERYVKERNNLFEIYSRGCCPAANYLCAGSVTKQSATVSMITSVLHRVTQKAVSEFLSEKNTNNS